jgi:hypothetical protein
VTLVPDFTIASRRLFAAIAPAFVAASVAVTFAGSEESGGSVTGPLQHLLDMGTDLLFVAIVLVAWTPRTAAVLCGFGAVLCLPNYSYGYAPGLYRWLFPGTYLHGNQSAFAFAPFDLSGTIALLRMIRGAWQTLHPMTATLMAKSEPALLAPRQLYAAMVPAVVMSYFIQTIHADPAFIQGVVTGRILGLHTIGGLVLLFALILSTWRPKIVVFVGAGGVVLCLPVYVWMAASGLHDWARPGSYGVPALHYVGINVFGFAGLLTSAMFIQSAIVFLRDRPKPQIDGH